MMPAMVWMGYLIDALDDFTVIQSPFTMEGIRVFGADSDATTLAVAAVLHRLQRETINSISVPEGVDGLSIALATGVAMHTEEMEDEAEWDVLMSEEATLVLARHGADVHLTAMDVEIEVDAGFYHAMERAWDQELSVTHVSQGAYVSRAQYEEAGTSRLSLTGQLAEDGPVWPPRFNHLVDSTSVPERTLQRTGTIQTWTTLSAAGAPSEFSLRAPLLGGISTVLLRLDDGPNGVFLTVDDEDPVFAMDSRMELVFRRLYAQEGFIRYGLKARSVSG
tara:strand:+ start:92 stop:925 length:834 start_codon:yes stop_codon:yes gene_type:complete